MYTTQLNSDDNRETSGANWLFSLESIHFVPSSVTVSFNTAYVQNVGDTKADFHL